MATYAAYRHIELDKIGYGKKRVLKPPGGGSSDIFGSDNPDGKLPRRNVRSHEASLGAILKHEDGQLASQTNKPKVDSHSRLFGPPLEGQATPSKNRMKSNIPIGETAMNGHAENGHINGDTSDGNPVTGNGYPENGINGNGSIENGHVNGYNGHSTNGHRRVPPGGFSSGLW